MKNTLLVLTCLGAGAMLAHAAPTDIQKDALGVSLTHNGIVTRVDVWSECIIRVTHRPASGPKSLPASFSVVAKPWRVVWSLADDGGDAVLSTPALKVRIAKSTGAVRILDAKGATILGEAENGTSIQPATVGGISTLASRQQFALDPAEAIFGLGQQPGGVMNWVGHSAHLMQENMHIAVPVLISSKGYGVFWDNPAITDVKVSQADAPAPVVEWNSEAGTGIDYYVFYGPEINRVIAGYRQLTGAAPMFGRWGFGFWQCKQRYHSQEQLLDIVARYRQMQVPIDGIIQDWLWWFPNPWGSHQFDKKRYPDPEKMMKQLHGENVHLLISVWAKFDVGSENANKLAAAKALYPQVIPYVWPPGRGQWYDPFSAEGRRIYWDQMSKQIFSKGVDGWWLDASEVELSGHWGEFRDFKTAAGSGALVFNAYPLMHTTGIYQGQRAENPNKRVFILTRSAYAGQQRNAAVAWSGDINGTWDVYRQQIPNGINFCLSGIPYWNTDTGGFGSSRPHDPKYQELFTRWFQFSAFCPMFRVHGDATGDCKEPTEKDADGKEMWNFAPGTQKILIDYDNLRYHLLPYIYSVAWKVTSESDTMMRGLVMDFRNDPKVYDIPDQYLFGPALMVNPVTQEGAQSRKVYLPAGTGWTDFWTGKTYTGGQTIDAAAPVQTLPLFVRAGSIIPYGPQIQFAAAKADPIELRVYPGADGTFTLYEDEGDNYNYEKGAYSTIPMRWDEKNQKLTIGARHGNFPGMLKTRTFRIVWVNSGHGAGIASSEKADAQVNYNGAAITVAARP
jgi:alpha-D-xyloside xylohydrolase